MIALPSNKKIKLFFKLFYFKNYMVQIIANEEISSVYGSAAQGLNLPNVFYLNLSLDNFKPKHTYFREIIPLNDNYPSPEFDIIIKV